MKVSSFQSTTRPCFYIESAPKDRQYVHFSFKNLELEKVFQAIKSGAWARQIELAKSKRGGWDENKKNLPCFTPSGTFRIRNDWDLIEYSRIICLDYDGVTSPLVLRDHHFSNSLHCFATFISPGGQGVKVFVRVNTGVDQHAEAWSQVRKHFDLLANHKSDPTGRNLSRLCFVSTDPGLYYNKESTVFEVAAGKTTTTIPDLSLLANPNSVFGYLYNLTVKGKYQGEALGEYGSRRNNFLFVFACNCNRHGIAQPTAFEFVRSIWIQNNLGFSLHELSKTVVSAYSHKAEFGTFRLPKSLVV